MTAKRLEEEAWSRAFSDIHLDINVCPKLLIWKSVNFEQTVFCCSWFLILFLLFFDSLSRKAELEGAAWTLDLWSKNKTLIFIQSFRWRNSDVTISGLMVFYSAPLITFWGILATLHPGAAQVPMARPLDNCFQILDMFWHLRCNGKLNLFRRICCNINIYESIHYDCVSGGFWKLVAGNHETAYTYTGSRLNACFVPLADPFTAYVYIYIYTSSELETSFTPGSWFVTLCFSVPWKTGDMFHFP